MFQGVAISLLWLLIGSGGDSPAKSHELTLTQRASAKRGVPRDTLITLERTPCFGECPSYKLTISADGTVVYEGRQDVKQSGTIKSRISRAQIKQLVAEFERVNYFSLRDSYSGEVCPETWTDHPSAVTSLRLNGRSKTVRHYHGCKGLAELAKLTDLERRIDRIVNTARWVNGAGTSAP